MIAAIYEPAIDAEIVLIMRRDTHTAVPQGQGRGEIP